ncbi:protein TIC 21, chloroplastic-like [Impatiens glandulifera]|uniref:protein TIC 21, chloroplastic-like n=1 Tax=Impatiens glandulifera TaxID=253017 RepID=UPI001FB0905B|nr:protein TIC 21, chloroplastic-like [Impatiens glandulifera]
MQSLLHPAALSGGALTATMSSAAPKLFTPHLKQTSKLSMRVSGTVNLSSSHSSFCSLSTLLSCTPLIKRRTSLASTPICSYQSPINDDLEKAKLAQVSKRLLATSANFKRFGSLGFWGQLTCTIVSAVILSFSVVVTGQITSPTTFYLNAAGIAAGFISIFWSFGYIRLSEKLRKTANQPSKAPPRAEVVQSLKNGILLNLLGMGAAILGMMATVGSLVAKSLTSSANPFGQGISPGYKPVLALDVFLVQASANTILSHFLGLVFSLELLRSVTLSPSDSTPIPGAV